MEEIKYTIQSVEKACDLLMAFGDSDQDLGVSELSRNLNINKSTVWKLLNTFEKKGFITRNPSSERYRLSVNFFRIACQYYNQISINAVLRKHMEKLSKKYNETIHFGVLDNDEVVYVEKLDGAFSINIYSKIGKRSPLYAPSLGKAILANLDSDQLSDIVKRIDFHAFTPYTITDKDSLIKELDLIRERGYSTDEEEYELGIRCVGVPIKNIAGVLVGAISVSGTTSRMTPELIETLVVDMKLIASEISTEIGYNT